MVVYETFQADGTGVIVTKTVMQGGTPPEFEDPLNQQGLIGVVIIELDEGVQIPVVISDINPENIGIGDEVESVLRSEYTQEGNPRYGVKSCPVE